MKQRQPAAEHIGLAIFHLVDIALDRRVYRQMGMHHALGIARGAAGVHEQGRLVVVNINLGQSIGLACLGLCQRYARQSWLYLLRLRARDDERHLQLLQNFGQPGQGQQLLIDHHCRHLCMPQDVVDARYLQLDIDGHPHLPRLVNGIAGHHHVYGIGAQHADLLARPQRREQIMREARTSRIQLGIADALSTIDQRRAAARLARTAVEQITQRNAPDAPCLLRQTHLDHGLSP